jgi:hypothetical protein
LLAGSRILVRPMVVAAMVAVALLAATPPAAADAFGNVNCDQMPTHPECELEAGSRPAGEMTGTPSGEMLCRLGGEVVPCVTDEGWLGANGCRYLRLEGVEPPSGTSEPGAAYRMRCPGDPPGSERPLVWLPDSQAPGPAALARHAVSRLVLPQPAVELNPSVSAAQLVGLPTWLWVEPVWWTPHSASAFVPGVTVTATATPTQVRWVMGDGAVVTCSGAGTPYAEAADPAAASPDCGHTYRRSSAAQPGGVYAMSATVTWQVSWSGGGASGALAPLTSTTQVLVPVAEVQAVIVR